MQRADFRHFISLPVRWGDMDALSHVNNVEYLRYLESGRIAYMETLRPAELPPNQHMVIVDVQCRFLRQLYYPMTVEVATRISRLGNRSMQFQATIYIQGEDAPAATSTGTLVWYDFATGRSAPLPEAVRTAIVEYEPVAPEQ